MAPGSTRIAAAGVRAGEVMTVAPWIISCSFLLCMSPMSLGTAFSRHTTRCYLGDYQTAPGLISTQRNELCSRTYQHSNRRLMRFASRTRTTNHILSSIFFVQFDSDEDCMHVEKCLYFRNVVGEQSTRMGILLISWKCCDA